MRETRTLRRTSRCEHSCLEGGVVNVPQFCDRCNKLTDHRTHEHTERHDREIWTQIRKEQREFADRRKAEQARKDRWLIPLIVLMVIVAIVSWIYLAKTVTLTTFLLLVIIVLLLNRDKK